jgi:uncharacterized SAM-binding protein YcdF (DUF218 family)
VAQFVWFLFSSGGAIVVLVAGVAWTVVSRGSRNSRRFLIAAALLYWAAGAYIVPETVKRLFFVSGYAPLTRADVPPGRTAVLLFGSGGYQFRDWSGNRFSVVDRIGASRLLEAARVFRLLDADYILSSGGLIKPDEGSSPSGSTMADALKNLGIPADRILIDTEAQTTHHQALIIKEMLAAHPVDRVVLVTSQFHMRRSMGTLKAVGIDAIPAIPFERRRVDTWWEMVIPTDKGLEETSMAAHEVAGIVGYGLRGWYRF